MLGAVVAFRRLAVFRWPLAFRRAVAAMRVLPVFRRCGRGHDHDRQNQFLGTLAGSLLAAPLTAGVQPGVKRVYTVGVLTTAC
jgi:hypothetical protein